MCDGRIVFVAGRDWAVRVDSGGILLFMYSIIWSYSEQKPKRENVRFYDGLQATDITDDLSAK